MSNSPTIIAAWNFYFNQHNYQILFVFTILEKILRNKEVLMSPEENLKNSYKYQMLNSLLKEKKYFSIVSAKKILLIMWVFTQHIPQG